MLNFIWVFKSSNRIYYFPNSDNFKVSQNTRHKEYSGESVAVISYLSWTWSWFLWECSFLKGNRGAYAIINQMKQVVTRFVIKITFSRNHTPQKPTAVTVGSLCKAYSIIWYQVAICWGSNWTSANWYPRSKCLLAPGTNLPRSHLNLSKLLPGIKEFDTR